LKERKREFLRGSFEDVSRAQEELMDKIGDATVPWSEIEKLAIRAFCGFIPQQLKRLLNIIRRYRLGDDPDIRLFLKTEVLCHLDLAQRQVFTLSSEKPARGGIIEE